MENLENKHSNEDQSIKSDMEKMVPSYDSYMRNITFGREHILREITVELAQVKPGDAVLEVGCGTGTLTLAAKRKAGPTGKVFGIDLIPGMIEVSQQKSAEAKEKITFQIGSIDDIPFSANQFDVVMCSFMIFHMSETTRKKGIAEIFRVLKPDGRLFVLDLALPARPIPKAVAAALLGFMIQNDLKELLPVMKESGFSNIESVPVDFRILGFSLLAGITGVAKKN